MYFPDTPYHTTYCEAISSYSTLMSVQSSLPGETPEDPEELDPTRTVHPHRQHSLLRVMTDPSRLSEAPRARRNRLNDPLEPVIHHTSTSMNL